MSYRYHDVHRESLSDGRTMISYPTELGERDFGNVVHENWCTTIVAFAGA